MQHFPGDQFPHAPADSAHPSAAHRPADPGAVEERAEAVAEPRGCLFALSQPPLMLFLAFLGALFLLAAMHDLFLL